MHRTVERIKAKRHTHRQRHFLIRALYVIGGFAILAAGVAMVALPGPAVLVFPVGLVILALEFAWAERLLERALAQAGRADQALATTSAGKLAATLGALALVLVVCGAGVCFLFGLPG